MNQFDKRILFKYLVGHKCTSEEESRLLEWLKESEENMDTYLNMKQFWIQKKIRYYSQPAQIEKALDEFHRRTRVYTIGNKGWGRRVLTIAKYAAVILILVAIPLIYRVAVHESHHENADRLITVTVPENSTSPKVLTLPDGSKIWVNNGSTFRYPLTFHHSERRVILNGEAYLEVKHNSNQPFIVQTPSVCIRVCGTSFDVKTNTSDNTIKTTLVTGRVVLQNEEGKTLAALSPGEMAVFNKKSKQITIGEVNTALYTDWRLGMIVFDQASMEEIKDRLKEIYKVNILVRLKSPTQSRINFAFRKEQPIDSVLEMLKFVAPITYQRDNQRIVICDKK